MSEENLDTAAQSPWLEEPVDREARPVAPVETLAAVLDRPSPAEAGATANPDGQSQTDRLNALIGAIDSAPIPQAKAATLKLILKSVRDSIDNALRLLEDDGTARSAQPIGLIQPAALFGFRPATAEGRPAGEVVQPAADRVVEGVFDGEGMIGDDGKSYNVPPNYASKSKLVEGDLLKLTIGTRGNFIYKQIGPIERQRLIGTLAYDQESSSHLVLAGGRSWKVLKASVTYFRGETGDEAVILVPKNAPSKWAAVENIIKNVPGAKR